MSYWHDNYRHDGNVGAGAGEGRDVRPPLGRVGGAASPLGRVGGAATPVGTVQLIAPIVFAPYWTEPEAVERGTETGK